MLRHAHLGLSVALLFCFQVSSAEAGMNKCTDGKQITYTNEPCEKMGLKSAGPIKDAVTVMPAVPIPQKENSENPGKDHGENNETPKNKAPMDDVSGADASKAATIKPVSPLVNKMLDY